MYKNDPRQKSPTFRTCIVNNYNEMIKITEEDLKRSRTLKTEYRLVVEAYKDKGKWASKCWLFMIVLGDGMFYCKAIFGTLYSASVGNLTLIPIHEMTYPPYIEEKKNEFHIYAMIFGFQAFYLCFTSVMYLGFLPLGPKLTMHAYGQIELVIKQVEKMFSEYDIEKEEVINKMQDVVRHMQRIYSFVDQIQKTHKLAFEMSLKTSAVIIPFCCFGVLESYNKGSISFDLIGYILSCLMNSFIPCYYCEVLLRKGSDLRVAVYGCGWEKHWVPRTRPMILMMLTRTMRPLAIQAVFRTVCLEAFTDVTNQAYRIFNVMNAARNRS